MAKNKNSSEVAETPEKELLPAPTIFNLHPSTGELVSQGLADRDPEDPENFLIPAYATTVTPPALDDNQAALFQDEAWTVVPDYRGTEVTVLGKKLIITELGKTPDDFKPSEEAQAKYEADAALQDVLQRRQDAYIARGWATTFDLIEDILARGAETVQAEREAIKAEHPKPEAADE